MALAAQTRPFRVHARHVGPQHARTLEEPSFEAAAVAYVETLHDIGGDQEISVIVRELDSGHAHCFRINLETGETAVCG